MDIGNIPYHAFPNIDYALSASQGSRVAIPVAPASYIYSHFRHISGVPAPRGVEGVSIAKLQVIDSLIEELVRLRAEPRPSFDLEGNSEAERMNALIEDLQNQVKNAQPPAGTSPYPSASPDLGIVFNIAA